jgi:hypothetical protein
VEGWWDIGIVDQRKERALALRGFFFNGHRKGRLQEPYSPFAIHKIWQQLSKEIAICGSRAERSIDNRRHRS